MNEQRLQGITRRHSTDMPTLHCSHDRESAPCDAADLVHRAVTAARLGPTLHPTCSMPTSGASGRATGKPARRWRTRSTALIGRHSGLATSRTPPGSSSPEPVDHSGFDLSRLEIDAKAECGNRAGSCVQEAAQWLAISEGHARCKG